MPITSGQQGYPLTLFLNFYDEEFGTLADPSAITLDITYGSEVGFVPDISGPYVYTPGNPAEPGLIYRIGTGQYACIWPIPSDVISGIYVANWSCVYGADTFLVTENIAVSGGFAPPVPSGDTGYWTGTWTYNAPYGTITIPLGGVDEDGTAWLIKKLEGWDSPPAAVGQVVQRSGDHGGWPTQQLYGPRIITLTLSAAAQTQALRDQARAKLQQAVPVDDLATFAYDEPIPKQVYVRRNASATVAESCPTLTDVDFTIPLVAPDPRKYATAEKSASLLASPSSATGITIPTTVPFTLPAQPLAGSTAVANAGNFETRPVITVRGPITSPSLVNVTSGQAISYTGLTLSATDQLVIDLDSRQGFLNGAFRAADVTSAWWVLWPGDSVLQLAGITAGDATATVTFRDAWT